MIPDRHYGNFTEIQNSETGKLCVVVSRRSIGFEALKVRKHRSGKGDPGKFRK